MKTLVIYGSAYGNTEKVAKLIAGALNVKARLVRDVTADKIDNLLKVKGGQLIAGNEGFIVADKTGPLTAGEIDRVKKWAGTIAGKA